MNATAVWQVMTPINGRFGSARWFHPLIVAVHEKDAIRIAEQESMRQGFAFVGDIAVLHVRNAVGEVAP